MFRIVAICAVLIAVIGLAVPAEAGNCFGGQTILAPQAIVFPGYQSLVTGPQLLVQPQPVFVQPQQFLVQGHQQQFLVQGHQRQLILQQQRQPFVQKQVIRSQPILFPKLRGF